MNCRNTPLPNIKQWFAESRGLGVAICAVAQATSQLDVIYGPLQGKAIREVVPATLIMYGAHEEELMRSAAFWGGKTTRSHQITGTAARSASSTGDGIMAMFGAPVALEDHAIRACLGGLAIQDEANRLAV